MLRYHYGTPQDDGPHDGYRATTIRNRHGLDRFAPPSDQSGDRWNEERDSGSANGDGRWSGGGLGRHFRQGQAESEAFWNQRLQSQLQARRGLSAQTAQMGAGQYAPNAGVSAYYAGQMQEYAGGSPAFQSAYNVPREWPKFQPNYNNEFANANSNYQYAPPNVASERNYYNATALRHAVSQRPIGTLLRNGQGGFNRIYMP